MRNALIITTEELTELMFNPLKDWLQVSDTDLDRRPFEIHGVYEKNAIRFIRNYGNHKEDWFVDDELYLTPKTMSKVITNELRLPEDIYITDVFWGGDGVVAVLSAPLPADWRPTICLTIRLKRRRRFLIPRSTVFIEICAYRPNGDDGPMLIDWRCSACGCTNTLPEQQGFNHCYLCGALVKQLRHKSLTLAPINYAGLDN